MSATNNPFISVPINNLNPRRRYHVEMFLAWLNFNGRKRSIGRTDAQNIADELAMDPCEVWTAIHDAYAIGDILMRQRGPVTWVEMVSSEFAAPSIPDRGPVVHVQKGVNRGK